MRQYLLNVTLLLSGFYVIVGLSTIMVLQLALSGDSIIQRQNNTMPQLTQNK